MKRNLDIKNYKTIDDYLPSGYSIDWDTTMSEDNEIVFDIRLLDPYEDVIEYWYCTPDIFNKTVVDIIKYAEIDMRNQKINYIINGENKKV
jgi:hypothetical protein